MNQLQYLLRISDNCSIFVNIILAFKQYLEFLDMLQKPLVTESPTHQNYFCMRLVTYVDGGILMLYIAC